jgi:hypothetical protein
VGRSISSPSCPGLSRGTSPGFPGVGREGTGGEGRGGERKGRVSDKGRWLGREQKEVAEVRGRGAGKQRGGREKERNRDRERERGKLQISFRGA